MLRGEVTVNLGTARLRQIKKPNHHLMALTRPPAATRLSFILQLLGCYERPAAFRPSLTRGLALIYVSWKKIGTGGVFYAQMMAVNEKANGRNVGAFGFY